MRKRHCAILAVGIVNHRPSTVGRAKRSRDFGGKTNKSISPLYVLPVCRDWTQSIASSQLKV